MISLENQAAVITGASSGIGKAIAMGLPKQKVSICLVGRNVSRLENLKSKLVHHAPRVIVCEADLCHEMDVDTIAKTALNEFENIHLLVHSAGFLLASDIENESQDRLNRHFRINFSSPLLLTQSLLQSIKTVQGQIVFINSSAIQRAIPKLGSYSASKFALKGLADCLREEVNGYGVRVISVYPGQTATPMQQKLHQEKGQPYKPDNLMQPEDISDVVIHALTLSRTAEMTEIFVRSMRNPVSEKIES